MLGSKRTEALAALAVAATMLLAACGGDDDDAASDDTAATADDSGGTSSGGSTDDELVDPPAGGTSGDAVDVCSLIAPVDISEALGTEFDIGTAGQPQGALLGQCDFSPVDITTAEVSLVSISARPANEYEGTVEVSGNATPLDGFSVDANQTDAGVMLNYPDFMIVVLAVGANGIDGEAAEAVARALDERMAG
jgi:hypothetical protein